MNRFIAQALFVRQGLTDLQTDLQIDLQITCRSGIGATYSETA